MSLAGGCHEEMPNDDSVRSARMEPTTWTDQVAACSNLL